MDGTIQTGSMECCRFFYLLSRIHYRNGQNQNAPQFPLAVIWITLPDHPQGRTEDCIQANKCYHCNHIQENRQVESWQIL